MKLRLAAILLIVLAGCGDPKSNMARQPRQATYDASDFFADGASARPLVAGVVPRDGRDVPGLPYAGGRTTSAIDVAPLNQSVPFPITPERILRGQQQYEIFCAVCHGRLGNGRGMIPQRGLTPPPSFHVPRLRQAPDAHFYNVITHGYGAMFSYNDRVPPAARWEIVAYVRALQAAPEALPGPVPEPIREALTGSGDPNSPRGGQR